MDESRREDLLGYLIGALEEDESQKVRKELERNETAQLELASLRKGLRPLAAYANWSEQLYEPPQNLAERTCSRIWDKIDSGLPEGDFPDERAHEKENVLSDAPNEPALPLHPVAASSKRIAPRMNIGNEYREKTWADRWKSSDLITVACVGIMLLFLAIPAFQFVKTQVVQIVFQHRMQKFVDSTAVITQFQEDIPFFKGGAIPDESEYVYSSGTDLGSLLLSFGETNLSQRTLEYLSPGRIVISNGASPLKIPGTEHQMTTVSDTAFAQNFRSQYVQSVPFPQVSGLFTPNSPAFPITTRQMGGFTFADWGKTPVAVFSEAGKEGPSGAFVQTNDVQHIFFRDGRVFFRKTGFGK